MLCTQAISGPCLARLTKDAATHPTISNNSLIDSSATRSLLRAGREPSGASIGRQLVRNAEKCESCRASLPEKTVSHITDESIVCADRESDCVSLRTREETLSCAYEVLDASGDPAHQTARPPSLDPDGSKPVCHVHHLEYVSSSTPVESDVFASLRRATIRTLSGEQLPRGQASGPLCFGDSSLGYTIAYVFRLPDEHARGRQRYYALIALAGVDSRRVLRACSLIWSCFEQIALHIIEMAEEVALQVLAEGGSPLRSGQRTPVSSFLTGGALDPDRHPRQCAANVRPNGISALVGDERFFCELHMMFVGILQDLGRCIGGLTVEATR